MAVVQKKLVGIDIGTMNIKMVKVNAKGRVTRYAYVDLPEKIIVNGKIESKQMLIETLKLARKKLRTSFKDCVLCLNSPEIVIRQILIPQMEDAYIRKNILLELAGFLPVSPDRYVIEYIITDRIETEDRKQIQILVFAAPADIVKSFAYCIKSAGFKLHYIDIMENAYEKLYKMLKTKNMISENNFACLYIDNSKASVSIYGDGKFFINKVIDNGIGGMCEEIAQKTNKPFELVKKLLYTNDILAYGETFVVEKSIIENYARNVAIEIMRVIDYFKSRNKDNTINVVYLSGGFSHVKGIQAYFENILGLPVINASKYLDSVFKDVPKKNNGIDYINVIAVTLREENV